MSGEGEGEGEGDGEGDGESEGEGEGRVQGESESERPLVKARVRVKGQGEAYFVVLGCVDASHDDGQDERRDAKGGGKGEDREATEPTEHADDDERYG